MSWDERKVREQEGKKEEQGLVCKINKNKNK